MICKCKDKHINSDFFVVEAEGPPLLFGLRACQELSLSLSELFTQLMLLQRFQSLMTLMTYLKALECEGEHHIEINPEVEYVIHLIKKVLFTLLPKLKQELKRVKQLGVPEKVDQPTEWVNSILMLEKPDGNLRICLDPKDLNRAVKREHFQLPTVNW